MNEQSNPGEPGRSIWAEMAARPLIGVAASIIGTILLVALLAPFRDDVEILTVGLILLLLTLVVSATWGWRVGLFAAVVANIALNFFFVPPHHELTVQDPENAVALAIFLLVSIVGGSLLSQAHSAADLARRRQAETETVLQLSRDLIGRTDPRDALEALCENVVHALGARGAAVLSRSADRWTVLASTGDAQAGRAPDPSERSIADRAIETGHVASLGHTGLRHTRARRVVSPTGRVTDMTEGAAFAPLIVGERQLGVLRLDGPIANPVFATIRRICSRRSRARRRSACSASSWRSAAAHAEALRQADEMKTALMTSISHDLKTPLAGIKTSVSSLLDDRSTGRTRTGRRSSRRSTRRPTVSTA